MTSARLLLALLLLLAPTAAAQATPPAAPPAWEGQFTDGRVTVTLFPRADAVAGWIDVGGALHPLRARVGAGGLSGSFSAGAVAFEFDARLEKEALLLESEGKSLRLRRRVPTAGEAGGSNPLAGPIRPVPQPGDGPDLRHVHVGQRYTFEMQNDMQQVWTVKEVGVDFVKYEMAMIMGGNPLGDPTEQEWRYTAPVGGGGQDAPWTDVKMTRETLVIAGIEFDCMVCEASGYKSWLTMTPGSDTIWTFPGAIKTVQLSDGAVINELTAIE
jgi:hypothetical protein